LLLVSWCCKLLVAAGIGFGWLHAPLACKSVGHFLRHLTLMAANCNWSSLIRDDSAVAAAESCKSAKLYICNIERGSNRRRYYHFVQLELTIDQISPRLTHLKISFFPTRNAPMEFTYKYTETNTSFHSNHNDI